MKIKTLLPLFIVLFFCSSLFAQDGSSLTFSEVMFYPSETNGEFIEIYNTSSTDTVDLTGYKIKYYTSSNTSLVALSGGMKLAPNQYAVILQGLYDYTNGNYKNIIPSGTLILKTSTNNFGSSGMANSTDRDINLINASSVTIDSYTYTASNSAGISDEKILLTKTNTSNWSNSLVANGTPGYKNSVAPLDHDLKIRIANITPATPAAEDSATITFVVKNLGQLTSGSFSVNLFNDADHDTVGDIGENIFTGSYSNLAKDDSLAIQKKIYIESSGTYWILANLSYSGDENTANNKSYFSFTATEKPAAYNDIVINEAMYTPTSPEPEWVELYNRSSRKINLRGWKIGDSSTLVAFVSSDYYLDPGAYLVLSKDTTIVNYFSVPSSIIVCALPSLNNSGDGIRLKTNTNILVDSLYYSSDWGGSIGGKSLERISTDGLSTESTNWGTSVSIAKATPGKMNSISPKANDLVMASLTSSVTYAQTGKPLTLTAKIKNNGSSSTSNYTVKLYLDKNGDGTATIDELLSQTSGVLIAAGAETTFNFIVNNVSAGINKFIALVDFSIDEFTENNSTSFQINGVVINEVRGDLVINEIMYAPTSPEPEWIEIYNASSKTIDLKGYQIADDQAPVKIFDNSFIISPGEFVVVAKDSNMFSIHGQISKAIVRMFASLNNSGDRVQILDSLGRVIDSLNYSSSWGGTGGKSLERVDPTLLSNNPQNWKSSTSPDKSTPGKRNSVAERNYDLVLKSFSADKTYIEVGDKITTSIQVENVGKLNSGSFNVQLYIDANHNLYAETNELVAQQQVIDLPAKTSATYSFDVGGFVSGKNNLMAVVNFLSDEYLDNNTASLQVTALAINERRGDLVINEIMYTPTSSEPEWIEIFNTSNKTVEMKGYKISDAQSTTKVFYNSYILSPGQYVVVAKDSSFFDFHPNVTNVIFSTFGSLNNTGDRIMISDSLGRTIDSLYYSSSWGGTNAFSLERIDPTGSSTAQTNWGTSKSVNKSTPGVLNSIAPHNYDLFLKSFTAAESYAEVGKSVNLKVTVSNLGKLSSGAFTINIYRDANFNSIAENSELVQTEQIADLGFGITESYSLEISDCVAGQNKFIAQLVLATDQVNDNNSASLTINGIQYNEQRGDLVINEIMYAPNSSEPEWVEIYNNSTKTVDMKGYRISEEQSTAKVFYNPYQLLPKQYIVVAKDSSFFDVHPNLQNVIIASFGSLNNSGDRVMISDSLGRIIDSLYYNSSWGGSSEKSLERIDPAGSSTSSTNWGTSISINKSTPGLANSLIPHNYDLSVKSFTSLETYAEVGKTFVAAVTVANLGKLTSGAFTIKIYRDANFNSIAESSELVQQKQVNDLAAELLADYSLEVSDFIQGQNQFIVKLELAADEVSENNSALLTVNGVKYNEQRGDLVINEIMYTPSSPEPEWIEIYNNSSKTVEMKGYRISEDQSTSKVFHNSYLLLPGQFVVAAKDSNFFSVYPNISNVVIGSFGSLNNSGDKVMISDSLGRVIDSLSYTSSWGGTTAKSLERVNASGSSTDPTNWRTSQSPYRATPGAINSVRPKNYDLAIQGITTDVSYAIVGKEFTINTHIINAGTSLAENYEVSLYRDKNWDGLATSDELVGTIAGTKINSGSTAAFQFKTSDIERGANNFISIINFLQDEYTDNNSYTLTLNGVVISENKGDLVINEFMYAPTSPEPEWLEIYNNSSKQIDLRGYKISNHSSSTKVFNQSVVLNPAQYFVVAKDSSIITKYGTIPNIVIASFPSLSNSGDKVILRDSLDRAIDSLEYKSTWGKAGKSLERWELSVSSTDSVNWVTSSAVNGGTPGYLNSCAKKDYDVRITSYSINPEKPMVGQAVKINAMLWNPGKNEAVFDVKLFEILDNGQRVLLFKKNESLHPIEDGGFYLSELEYTIDKLNKTRTFEYYADFPADQDTSNNRMVIKVQPGYPAGSVVINEIMYSPANGEPEWVELYNNSVYDIDIYGWSISDVVTTPVKTTLKPAASIIPANTFFVIVKDSSLGAYHNTIPGKQIITSFANLNNDGDGVVIKDSRDVSIDSVRFESSWGGTNGKSLERKTISGLSANKTNWASSKDIELSTPGRTNSYIEKKNDLVLKSVTTNPLAPSTGDNVTITAKVLNTGSLTAAYFSVKYYLISGSDTTSFDEKAGANLAAGDSVLIAASNKLNVDGKKVVLVKIIFVDDENTSDNSYKVTIYPGVVRGTVLISEVMFDPYSGESEWIEIFNASKEQVNLANWSISDLLPSPTKAVITTKDELLNPGEYAIISSDTAKFPYRLPQKFYQAKFGALSATDGVVVYDFRGVVIDSLKYNSTWAGIKGQSIERLSFTQSTNDSTNWLTSLSTNGATPGVNSSVSSAKKYSLGNFVINEIMYDPASNNSEYLELYNITNDSIQVGGMQLKIGTSSKVKLANTLLKIAPKEYFVIASDSSIFDNYVWLRSASNVVVASSSFSLSNDGILLIIKDLFGNTIDSLTYTSSWHNKNILTTKNKSLERLNPSLASNDSRNWSTSVEMDGGTPGKANSIFTENISHDSKVSISPNPFSPDNDGFEDFTIINLDLNKPLSQVRIKVYDTAGRQVRILENSMPSASKNSIIFDGLDDGGRALRMGIYILLIETVAADGGGVETFKTPIVVARKL